MSMEPSKEAIEAAKATVWTTQLGYQDSLIKDSKRYVLDVESALKAAFAIDFAAHQQAMQGIQTEIDRLVQRLEDVNVKDSVKTREINLLVAENRNLLQQLAELKAISLCRCGDGFSLTDPGTCGNCMATYYQDRVITEP